jgi:hypothetical protein
MNDNTSRIVYFVDNSVMWSLFAFSAQMYLLNPEIRTSFFELFDYPEYLVNLLVLGNILGIVTILSHQ